MLPEAGNAQFGPMWQGVLLGEAIKLLGRLFDPNLFVAF
jgi:hypothetical protein